MFLFKVTLLLVACFITTTKSNFEFEKCCDFGKYLDKVNSSYKCIENDKNRFQLNTNNTNFLDRNISGTCLDGGKEFTKFKVENDNIVRSGSVNVEYFTKCCPLGYIYDRNSHGCIKTNQLTNSFVKDKFIKVGLPTCRIILDYNNFTTFDEAINHLEVVGGSINSYCIDQEENSRYVLRICEDSTDICKKIKCIRKCCPDGQSFVNGPNCVDSFVHGLHMNFTDRINQPEDPFAIIHKFTCDTLFHMNETRYKYTLNKNGELEVFYEPINQIKYFSYDEHITYCMEHSHSRKLEGYGIFMCFPENTQKEKFAFTLWAKILTCVCLFITILVYVAYKKTKNLFGKSLVCFSVAMLANFSILIYNHSATTVGDTKCAVTAYILYFIIISQFTWLNIICWDIWCTFGSTKSIVISQRPKDIKKFIFYSIYAWGIPLFLTLLILIFNINPILPFSIHPYIGKYKCLLEIHKGNYGKYLFKEIPLSILEIINTFFFIKTVMYCWQVKNEINRMNDTVAKKDQRIAYNADRERLFLIFKLSIVMGLSFLFEVVSGFFDMTTNEITKYVEIVWDTINCLQGVFVFIIFVCKKSIYQSFLQKLGLSKVRKLSMSSSSHTQMTVLTVPKN